jgi:phosphoserine phosphatase
MSHVLTLIAAYGAHGLLSDVADELCAAIGATHPPVRLAKIACDIPFRAASEAALADAHRALALVPANAPIDSFIQPVEGRRKRMLVADMDSTIIQQECLDEVAKAAGIGPKIAAITERAMRGELHFDDALRQRIALLNGFPESKLRDVLDQHIELMPGARELAGTMRANGARAVLVSGGFTFFTSVIAKRAGFDIDYGNRFIFEDGALAGVAEPILGQNGKLDAMEREALQAGIGLREVIAVGDGANDLAMIKAAGLGVAFRAKPIVSAEAHARINHGDLTALLYLQGYREEDFVTHV